ncbi:MAG: phage major capsid protein, partial [Actinomycetota bacterium]|nr:phage major capsid protein [Actinomycetota bacterium]
MADDNTGQGAPNGPTLTHSQCINRLQAIRDAMSQIAELEQPSAEDDRYFGELTAEFDQVDAHRMKLERDAQLARIKGVSDGLSASRHLRTVPGAPGGSSTDDYDRDAILEPDSIQAHR